MDFQQGQYSLSEKQSDVTIIFCDICDFDKIISSEDKKIVSLLDELFRHFDRLCNQYNVQKIEVSFLNLNTITQTVGKTYMSSAGLKHLEIGQHQTKENSNKIALKLAFEMQKVSKRFHWGPESIHCGEVITGVIGYHKPQFSLIGDTVNTTSRVCSAAGNSEILISEQVYNSIVKHSKGIEFFQTKFKLFYRLKERESQLLIRQHRIKQINKTATNSSLQVLLLILLKQLNIEYFSTKKKQQQENSQKQQEATTNLQKLKQLQKISQISKQINQKIASNSNIKWNEQKTSSDKMTFQQLEVKMKTCQNLKGQANYKVKKILRNLKQVIKNPDSPCNLKLPSRIKNCNIKELGFSQMYELQNKQLEQVESPQLIHIQNFTSMENEQEGIKKYQKSQIELSEVLEKRFEQDSSQRQLNTQIGPSSSGQFKQQSGCPSFMSYKNLNLQITEESSPKLAEDNIQNLNIENYMEKVNLVKEGNLLVPSWQEENYVQEIQFLSYTAIEKANTEILNDQISEEIKFVRPTKNNQFNFPQYKNSFFYFLEKRSNNNLQFEEYLLKKYEKLHNIIIMLISISFLIKILIVLFSHFEFAKDSYVIMIQPIFIIAFMLLIILKQFLIKKQWFKTYCNILFCIYLLFPQKYNYSQESVDISIELTEKYVIYSIFINLGNIHYFDACLYLFLFISSIVYQQSIQKFQNFTYTVIALILVSIMELKYQKDKYTNIISNYNQYNQQMMEKKRQSELVSQLLPIHVKNIFYRYFVKILEQFLVNPNEKKQLIEQFTQVTILFADIVNFTSYSSIVSGSTVVSMLSELFTQFDQACVKNNVFKLYTIGDCYVVIGLMDTEHRNFAEEALRVVSFAFDMIEIIKEVKVKIKESELGMRIGIHTGNIIGGVIGTEIVRYDIYGRDVLIANKMESNGKSGDILISAATKQLLEIEYQDLFEFLVWKEIEIQPSGNKINSFFINRVSNFTLQ